MNIINRYIIIHVIAATLIVTLALVGVAMFVLFLTEVGDIGRGDYNNWQAFRVCILELPQFMYQFAPMAGLIGCLAGLGTLAANSELIIIRTSGVSTWQIAKAVLTGAFMILIVSTIIGEGIAPFSLLKAMQEKAMAISGGQMLKTSDGIWVRDGSTFIYIGEVLPKQHLQGVRWFTINQQQQMTESGSAASAEFKDHHWILSDVNQTHFDGMKQVTAKHAATMNWQATLNPSILKLTKVDPIQMSLPELRRFIKYREHNNLQNSNYNLVFWQRLTQPLATLIIILLAIPFIFGPLRTVSMGVRILAGSAVGLVFYFINQIFGPLSMVYQLPVMVSALLPLLLCAMLAAWLITKVRY